MILVAIGCGRLSNIFEKVKKHSFVVFGTMDENLMFHSLKSNESIKNYPVYFYETG